MIDRYDHFIEYQPEAACLSALDELESVNSLDDNDQTAIYCAVSSGRLRVVEHLVELRADPNLRSAPENRTALHAACTHETRGAASCEMVRSMIQLLVKAGADLEILDNVGYTPLARAVAEANVPAVRELIAAGANPNHHTTCGYLRDLITHDLDDRHPSNRNNPRLIDSCLKEAGGRLEYPQWRSTG